MKKVLIASTALVAAGLLTTGSASAAEKIKLNLGGFSKWWVVGAWQDSAFEAGTGRGYANVDVKGDNEIFFGGDTTLDNGMKIGVNFELEAGGGTETSTSTPDVIDKSYVFIESGIGKVIVGSEANGAVLLHVMAPDAAANWGSEGLLISGSSIVQPATVSVMKTTEIDTDDNAEKITYVAPTFYGLTLGASYIPNASGTGNASKGEDNSNQALSQSVYGVGAGYANTFGPIGLKLSTGFVWGDANAAGVTGDLQELSAGTQLTWGPVTVGGSYRQRILDEKSGNGAGAIAANIDGRVWDAGIVYDGGAWQVSFAYLDSQAEDSITKGEDALTVYQVSGKYNLAPGVDLQASGGFVEWDDESAKASGNTGDANHNEGWTIATGIALTF
ncbi:MAG: porin [Alphaproteobacteria bacterium]|nr:porin [Alphaproteobacteria bacterium]